MLHFPSPTPACPHIPHTCSDTHVGAVQHEVQVRQDRGEEQLNEKLLRPSEKLGVEKDFIDNPLNCGLCK